jgi:hypothetical protein
VKAHERAEQQALQQEKKIKKGKTSKSGGCLMM